MKAIELLHQLVAIETDSCTLWPLATGGSQGYGIVSVDGRPVLAHRQAYRIAIGEPGPAILHSCDTPACVNPRHLRSGTQVENLQDMRDKGRQSTEHGKLTAADVALIRELYIPYDRVYGGPALARQFGVNRRYITRLVQ